MEYLLPGLVRWGHIVAGTAWIGQLYYFNLVQMAALQKEELVALIALTKEF